MKKAIKAIICLVSKKMVFHFCLHFVSDSEEVSFYDHVDRISLYYGVPPVYHVKSPLYLVTPPNIQEYKYYYYTPQTEGEMEA